jgi:hypothetical protein
MVVFICKYASYGGHCSCLMDDNGVEKCSNKLALTFLYFMV